MESIGEMKARIERHESQKRGTLSPQEVQFLYDLHHSTKPMAMDTTDVNLKAVLDQHQKNLAQYRTTMQQYPGMAVVMESRYKEAQQTAIHLQQLIQNQKTKEDELSDSRSPMHP